ncbi:MAG: SDR family NAD(P)-dependent oxidoreductase [Candidatus Omnitrophica bacterium]|nr:SDR family NAD(P)-dependent oxidoreductase [Candidatus Omnitrophota bacterium]
MNKDAHSTELKGFNAKFVLISGGACGIGLEFAKRLLSEGASVILVDKDELLCRSAKDILSPLGQTVIICRDLRDPIVRKEIFNELGRKNIAIDILINNVAIHHHGSFIDLEWEKIEDMIKVNLLCTLHLTHLFLKSIVKKGSGQILNISSTAGLAPCPYLATYSATKAFINKFSESLAIELEEKNIKVQWICIGATDTAFFQTAGMGSLNYVRTVKMMHPERVAADGIEFLKSSRLWGIIGWRNRLNIFLSRLAPAGILGMIARKRFR